MAIEAQIRVFDDIKFLVRKVSCHNINCSFWVYKILYYSEGKPVFENDPILCSENTTDINKAKESFVMIVWSVGSWSIEGANIHGIEHDQISELAKLIEYCKAMLA